MEKSLILNFNILEEVNISVNELILLYNVYYEKDCNINEIGNLELNKFIKVITKEKNKTIILREKGINLIELLLIDVDLSLKDNKREIKKVKSRRLINKEVEDNLHTFREKWKGLKPGSMGSLKSCKEKLSRWMKENPEYSFEDILKAADLYLSTEGQNVRYLQRADYFIFKKDGREESSRLSAFIDDAIRVKSINNEWTSKLN